ncbi:MAG TPA: GIY-YIG nuclease family protein [Sulfuricurvum sp.]|nr:GIY-YIG nuclease family protein [Sulfuricurvum sp.]
MKSSEKTYTLYILKCSDDTYYTGIAIDIEKRLTEHNTSDKGAKYTRSRRPVMLMYCESYPDKSSALKREIAIKRMKRSNKEALWLA